MVNIFGNSDGNGISRSRLSFANFGSNIFLLAFIGFVIIGLVVLSYGIGIYTNFLWFGNLGFSGVYETILLTKLWLFALGFIIVLAIGMSNLLLTYKYGRGTQIVPLADETLILVRPLVRYGSIILIVLASIVFAVGLSSQWSSVLGFLNATVFGLNDPQFDKDIGFYVFTLPLYSLVQSWLSALFVVLLLFTVAMYFFHFTLRGAVFSLTGPVRIHLSILGAGLLLTLAFGYWLDIYNLLNSQSGIIAGASYTDINARLPGLQVLVVITIFGALLLLLNAFWVRGVRIILGSFILWVAAFLLLGTVFPSIIQRVQVNPNELRKETPYLSRNIDMTRIAFGLDKIDERDYSLVEGMGISEELVDGNSTTIADIRLWDHRPFGSLLNQIQFFRPYYSFMNVDSDRYFVEENGKRFPRQILIGVRELDVEGLADEAKNWVNRKLVYTHGYGAVVAPVTQFEKGRPEFIVQDIPVQGEIQIDQPHIYYGENSENFVIVNSNQKELDYEPKQGDLIFAKYEGNGGVQLNSLIRRVAYAWKFRDPNILISGEITSESRIQYLRSVNERISTLVPSLILDSEAYPVIDDGRVFWVQDAYTTTDKYPYSDFVDLQNKEFNYIRNSVKIIMDAYHGEISLYVIDDKDPIIQTSQKIFPELFKPISEMSPGLREHIRYPVDLLNLQAKQYLIYHMTDPTEFFNKADQWDIPNEFFQGNFQPMEPYFLTMRLPGESMEEFILLTPFTPVNKINMAGWLAARSDGDQYGKLISFAFPKGVEILGPQQIEANIAADSVITRYFTLACEGEARCIRGNLLVIPLEGKDGNQLLYAEPLYLQASGVPFPELKQVILADSEKVVMECTLKGAVALLTGKLPVDPRETPGECLSVEILDSFEDIDSGIIPVLKDGSMDSKDSISGEVSKGKMDEIQDKIDQMMKSIESLQKSLIDMNKLFGGMK
ncbi:MAG: hypothetical protein CL785_05115 [Chloroflexi bacterium]|nr:hypothetical protein [Chloroflexota bacterium]